jgi:outer membrane immunogenic protein
MHKMKKSLIAAGAMALALSAGSAFAADLPSRKEPILPPPPPPPLWTGFYVGLNAGYTWSDEGATTTVAAPGQRVFHGPQATAALFGLLANVPSSNDGFIGGGQIGYNYQFSDNFVVGLEADIQGVAHGSNDGSAATAAPDGAGFAVLSTHSARRSLDYLGTVRGRLGWLVTPSLLVFGSGGLAYGGVNSSVFYTQASNNPGLVGDLPSVWTGAASFADTRVGWTAGGGVEWLFLPNWSAKVEYLYYDLGSVTVSTALHTADLLAPPTAFSNVAASTTRFNGHIVRAGVNYHFNLFSEPAPVVAKY